MRKIFETIGFMALICFSFFYSSKIATVIKNNDDLMKQIEDVQDQYKIKPIDCVIQEDTIIPGMSGSEINVKKSYRKMEQLNKFNDKLLVYNTIKPSVSIEKVYDKYIINGNKNKKEVSLLFLVKGDADLKPLLSILKEEKASFFIDGHWFEKNNDIIINMIKNSHVIGNLAYDGDYTASGVSWMNTIVTKIGGQKNTYCYNEAADQKALERCQLNHSYTIRPSIIAKTDPFINIKNNLTNGSIISLEVNSTTLKQLPLMLEFINTKGLKLVTLDTLIDE